ncbi:hypothetical protein C9J48_06030 [Photobacterium profundum]|uniref:Uncharacterized protein n=1 Tax=Photobacterium profundum 3TCK TaxID=314280 RepID=Q1Z9L3_9GAMM|nr:hypothetical protein P3TCK_05611 [Photobacterium profundum 3TCK]PSV63046.1 hypothetical protein C9J48_06030 [Photobacterium profundum]
MANEHATAIAHLINLKLHGSALARIRPCIESVIRGLWVYHCIEDQETAEKYAKKDGAWGSLESMVKNLDIKLESDSHFSQRYLGRNYGLLSSFTHGLSQQTERRFSGKTMSLKLSKIQMSEIIKEVCYLSYLANITIAFVANNEDAVKNLTQLWSKSDI